jgi:hypothetical protein
MRNKNLKNLFFFNSIYFATQNTPNKKSLNELMNNLNIYDTKNYENSPELNYKNFQDEFFHNISSKKTEETNRFKEFTDFFQDYKGDY